MGYGWTAAMLAPNWAAQRDIAREGDWIERAIHAATPTAAASAVQEGIRVLTHARTYWTADGHPREAARVQTVIDQLEGFAAEASTLTAADLPAWQSKLYAYQENPHAAWSLYLQASGQLDVALVAAAAVEGSQTYWVGAAAFVGGFAGAFLGGWIGAEIGERRARGGR